VGPAPLYKSPLRSVYLDGRCVRLITQSRDLQTSLVKTQRKLCSFRFEVTELPHVENALCSATSNEQLAERNGLH
jgi:hypothetical protein